MGSDSCSARKPNLIPSGKLPPQMLKAQLERIRQKNQRLRIGPRYGDDAAVIDMEDRFLVCATDPITLTSNQIGSYAVNINANDVAVMGAQPLWYWATVLLPEGGSDEKLVSEIFSNTLEACDELGVELCGGHTEVTIGLNRPIICGFMAGEATKERLVDKKNIRPGDAIILSRGIAIEGTATLAEGKAGQLEKLDPGLLDRARGFLKEPGISVVAEALLALDSAEVHGMHDPTEGGLFTGLRELAELALVGLEIDEKRINVLPETSAICDAIGLDPMGLLASGSLLVVSDTESAERIIDAYSEKGIPANIIGRTTKKDFGLKLKRDGKLIPLPEFERDEITRVTTGR